MVTAVHFGFTSYFFLKKGFDISIPKVPSLFTFPGYGTDLKIDSRVAELRSEAKERPVWTYFSFGMAKPCFTASSSILATGTVPVAPNSRHTCDHKSTVRIDKNITEQQAINILETR